MQKPDETLQKKHVCRTNVEDDVSAHHAHLHTLPLMLTLVGMNVVDLLPAT